MTMLEHLAASGVKLSQPVGLIVEGYDEEKKWRALYARIGRVCACVPDEAKEHEEIQSYDPKYDLLLFGKGKQGAQHLHVLRMTDDAVLYAVDSGGLIIENSISRMLIGQSDTFLDSVCGIWCALEQTPS